MRIKYSPEKHDNDEFVFLKSGGSTIFEQK